MFLFLICLQNLTYRKGPKKFIFLEMTEFILFCFCLFVCFCFVFLFFIVCFCFFLTEKIEYHLKWHGLTTKFFFHLLRALGDPPCRSQSHNRLCHQPASGRGTKCTTTRWPHGSQDDPGNDCDCSATRPVTFNNINFTL